MGLTYWKSLILGLFLVGLLVADGLSAQTMRLPKVDGEPLRAKQTSVEGEITIDRLVQIAMVNNPTLLQAAARVRALQGTQLQVGLYPNPNLGWVAEEMGNGGQAGRQGIGFSQEFVTANKLGLSRTTATRAVWAAEAQCCAQRYRVENDVRKTAYAILAFQERIAILEQLVEISRGLMKTTEQLFKAQEVSRADVLKAQIEESRTILSLQTARRNQEAVWQKLTGLLGCPDMSPRTISGTLRKDLPYLIWEPSLQRLLTESPLVREADAKISQSRWDLRLQCAERKPNIDVGAAVAYNDDSEYTEATLEVMIPLKIHNRNQGNIMRARAELMAAQQNRDRLYLVLHNRLAQAFREYKVAQIEVNAYRDTLIPKAEESLKLTNEGFRQSELSYLELLTSQRTFFRLSLDYVDSLEHLWSSSVDIQGLLLSGGLDPEP